MEIKEIRDRIENKPVEDQLKILTDVFPDKVLFTSSFGIEDQVISHLIFENDIPVDVATLDTGRLFPQTYKVFNETFKEIPERNNCLFP